MMIKKALLASVLATGLILPAEAGLYVPPSPPLAVYKPAIIKPENVEFSKHLLAMPLTMGMLPSRGIITSSVQFIASTSASSAAGSTSVTVNKPTGTANGDIIVIGVTSNQTASDTTFTLSGFTERMDSGTRVNCAVYTKTAGASEPSSYTINNSGSGRFAAVCVVYRSASVGVIGSVSSNTAGSTVTAPGITVSANGSLLLAFFFASQRPDPTAFSTPSGMSYVAGDADTTNNPALAIFSQAVNSGATGDRTSTLSSTDKRAFLMSLSP